MATKDYQQLISILCLVILFSCKNESEKRVDITYFQNNEIKFIKRYKDNLLQGEAQWFYESGHIEQSVIFKMGKENGNAYYFYKSGALKNHRYWREGKMVGYVADYFDDSIAIIKSVLFYSDDGKLIYKKSFDRSGKPVSEEGIKPYSK